MSEVRGKGATVQYSYVLAAAALFETLSTVHSCISVYRCPMGGQVKHQIIQQAVINTGQVYDGHQTD